MLTAVPNPRMHVEIRRLEADLPCAMFVAPFEDPAIGLPLSSS